MWSKSTFPSIHFKSFHKDMFLLAPSNGKQPDYFDQLKERRVSYHYLSMKNYEALLTSLF